MLGAGLDDGRRGLLGRGRETAKFVLTAPVHYILGLPRAMAFSCYDHVKQSICGEV